jgi:four helix bundle protein
MGRFSDDLSDRFMKFVVTILKLERELLKTYLGRHIYGQLFRAGTSAGANYEEARAGESRADFIHKMQIVLKELRESYFWTKLIVKSKLISNEEEALKFLYIESKELANIIAISVITAKSKVVKTAN